MALVVSGWVGLVRDGATVPALHRARIWLHRALIWCVPLNERILTPLACHFSEQRVRGVAGILDPCAVLLGCNLLIKISNHVVKIRDHPPELSDPPLLLTGSNCF